MFVGVFKVNFFFAFIYGAVSLGFLLNCQTITQVMGEEKILRNRCVNECIKNNWKFLLCECSQLLEHFNHLCDLKQSDYLFSRT